MSTQPQSRPEAPSRRRRPVLQLERRGEPPRWLVLSLPLGAVLLALVLGGLVLLAVGGNPLQIYAYIARSAFGDIGVFSDTLVKAIPLMLVGLACTLAFRMRLWNIGAEGQLLMGVLGASSVVLIPLLPDSASRWVLLPAMLLAAMLAGALWGLIPGLLRARFNVNEIISTLMLNYIAVALVDFFIFAVWSEAGFQHSRVFPRSAWLPRLTDYAAQVRSFAGLTVHLGLLLALVAAVVVWVILYRSTWGYEIRLIGDNPRAARFAGLPIARHTVLVMLVSGALAGMAGMSEVAGVTHRLQRDISLGYGFTGIIIAWLAKLHPAAVVLVSILFGALLLVGREIQPSGIPRMIQGIILVCLIASDFLLRYRIRLARPLEES